MSVVSESNPLTTPVDSAAIREAPTSAEMVALLDVRQRADRQYVGRMDRCTGFVLHRRGERS